MCLNGTKLFHFNLLKGHCHETDIDNHLKLFAFWKTETIYLSIEYLKLYRQYFVDSDSISTKRIQQFFAVR
jgi:hypothetical protein